MVQIIEKPDWVSWDDIHDVMWKAHEGNRKQGVFMRYPSLPGDEIRKRIEGIGKMFVALDGEKVVGTAAIKTMKAYLWCGKGDYSYLCFASVLPEYSGQGIYKQLYIYRERESLKNGISRVMFDTHESNQRMLNINSKNGFKRVDISVWKDHYNVVMVKWLDGCPYSNWHCKLQYLIHKWYRKLRYKPGRVKRFGI